MLWIFHKVCANSAVYAVKIILLWVEILNDFSKASKREFFIPVSHSMIISWTFFYDYVLLLNAYGVLCLNLACKNKEKL